MSGSLVLSAASAASAAVLACICFSNKCILVSMFPISSTLTRGGLSARVVGQAYYIALGRDPTRVRRGDRRCGTLGPRRARCQNYDRCSCISESHLSLLYDRSRTFDLAGAEVPVRSNSRLAPRGGLRLNAALRILVSPNFRFETMVSISIFSLSFTPSTEVSGEKASSIRCMIDSHGGGSRPGDTCHRDGGECLRL